MSNDYSNEYNNFSMDDMIFMPIFEFRFNKYFDGTKFDVFDEGSIVEDGGNKWDIRLPLNYTKLSKYLQI